MSFAVKLETTHHPLRSSCSRVKHLAAFLFCLVKSEKDINADGKTENDCPIEIICPKKSIPRKELCNADGNNKHFCHFLLHCLTWGSQSSLSLCVSVKDGADRRLQVPTHHLA